MTVPFTCIWCVPIFIGALKDILVFVWAQTEPAEVKQESEEMSSYDISLPTSIVYSDTDTLAHPNVSSHYVLQNLLQTAM